MNRDEYIDKLKKICALYSDILGVVILFGSYSRNEADDDSDIDLYIEPADVKMTTAKLGANKRYKAFKYDLYNTFEKEFDLLAYGGTRDLNSMKKSPLWTQIMKDGIVLYDQGTKAI